MTIKRIVLATWTALAFFAAHALGQDGIRAPNRFDVVQMVHEKCPGLIFQDHAFTDAVFEWLFREDPRWGRNGKRGNINDKSHDAGAFINPASPAGGVSIVDIIAAAGGPDARPAWQDVTQATIAAGTVGAWVRPSGVLPACLSSSSSPAPGPGPGQPPAGTDPTVPVPPPTHSDMAAVIDALYRIERRLDKLEEPFRHDDLAKVADYVDAMVGDGPPGGTGPHVTDIKQRLDVIRVQLEQLNAWLRGRSLLRY